MGKSYLTPLFWQHHESEEVLRQEIAQMHENGIGSFIVESRPHPCYLQEEWWSDLALIVEEAKKRGMGVWIFDDGAYPSGTANGLIRKKFPQYVKKYLAHHYVDAIGPKRGTSVLVNAWLEEGEELVGVVAGRRLDYLDQMEMESFTDLTDRVQNGVLYWDIPEGEWRIFILKQTEKGGEEWTKDYLNPLEPECCQAFLDLIYEEHYRHLKEEFGKTVRGFFTDEPRFGNASGYEIQIGNNKIVLPWSDTLLAELSEGGLGEFRRLLPALYYEAGDQTPDVRYLYMNAVSRRFGDCFMKPIGDWCRAHGVELIGHVVEENGAHARLGYGTGHYFRSLAGLDAAGMDVVNNIYPGRRDGKYLTQFNDYDTTFNHWGLSKMTSSAAHLDPKKKGRTVCEAYGAYGWSEGLCAMKWITDAMCVRGVNWIIPHAFSPKEFPDPDCAPHFYARGNNPQFVSFAKWADYTNRVCDQLSGGLHMAPAAVLYHAEAEWGGAYQPFETVVKTLMLSQMDCDVLPIDVICDREACVLENGTLAVNGEYYGVLIVPYARFLPKAMKKAFWELTEAGVPVRFLKDYPERYYLGEAFEVLPGMSVCTDENLVEELERLELREISLTEPCDYLTCYHYRKEPVDTWFFTNEDLYQNVESELWIEDDREAVWYDAMEDQKYHAETEKTEKGGKTYTKVKLRLKPYESIFLLFGESSRQERFDWDQPDLPKTALSQDGWKISVKNYQPESAFQEIKEDQLLNLAAPDQLPEFSGTIRYEKTFQGKEGEHCLLSLGEVYETARVWLNGTFAGERICPPYCVELDGSLMKDGENHLEIQVVNTLVKAHPTNFDRYWVQEPTGLLGPVCIIKKTFKEEKKNEF